MDARSILQEVRAERRRRVSEGGNKRLAAKDESELRRWEIARYTEAIQLDPELAEAYVARGTALYFEHHRAEARADMRRALSLHPKDVTLYHQLPLPFERGEQREILRAGMSLADPASFEYEHLRAWFIRTYWYEGNFAEQARLLEEWLPQLNQGEFQYRHQLQELAQAYSALDQHERAEATYRRALAVSPRSESPFIADMIVRSRMHRDQFAQAREAVGELRSYLENDRYEMFDAALRVLSDATASQTEAACAHALTAADLGTAPGPVGRSTSYYSFLLGLIYHGAGRRDAAIELLNRFAAESAANKREWGVTMRWEIAMARKIAG